MAKHIKNAVIAAIVVFIGTALVFGTGGSVVTLFGTVGTATAAAMYSFAIALTGSVVGGLTSKGMNASAGNFGSKFAARAATAHRQLVYGECRVGGTIVHMETTGVDNYLLHVVVVLAGHEIQSLESVRLNDTTLTTGTSTISGSTVYTATNSDFINTDSENNFGSGKLARYSFQNGSQTAADGFAVAQSSLLASDQFRSCAYIYLQLAFDPEAFGGGMPAISCVIKGKKVFDPRDNSTAWSDNPALCIRDFISNTQYGLKALTSEINDTTNEGGFATAANACEVDVTLADNSTTEDKYTANGFTNFGASGTGVLESLLSSMAGKMSYTNGQFNIFAGTTQTPSLTISDDNLLAPVSVATNANTGEFYNTVKPVYVDSTNDYIAADAPVYQDSTFLTEDTPNGVTNDKPNYVKQMEKQLPFTTTHTMAQRIGRLALKNQRLSTSVNCLVDLSFMKLQPADWVYVTNERLGYSQKIFEVISVNMEVIQSDETPVLGVRLALKETAASIYAFATSDYNANIAAGSNLASGGFVIAAPTSLSVATDTTTNDNLGTTSVTATWVNSASPMVIFNDLQFKRNGAADATYTSTAATKGTTKQTILGLEIGVAYNFRVRHAGVAGSYSAFSSVVNHTVAGTAQSLANYLNSNVTTTKTFFQNEVPTALSAGDLWIDSNDGNKIYRAHAAGADAVTANEWILTTITAGAIGLGSVLNQAQVTTFAQDGVPTATAIGDLWIDTNDGNKIYRAQSAGADQVTGGEWVVTTLTKAGIGLGNVADERQITIFRQDAVPTATAAGDLWYDTDNNNKQYRATSVGNNAVAANQWIEVTPDKIAVGLSEVDNTSDATTMAGTLTGQINDGTTNFTAAELLKIRAGFDGLDGTAVLKTLNANSALRNGEISLAANGTLSGAGTSVQVNLNSIPDAGNTKTHAGYAGTGLDSSGRVKVGIISGGVAVTVADIKDAKLRAFAGFDASGNVNRPVPSAQIAGAMADSLTADSTIAQWITSDGASYAPTGQTQDLTVTYDNSISKATCKVRWTWVNVADSNDDYISACAFTGSSTGFSLGSITTLSGNDKKFATCVVTHTATSETITLQGLLSLLNVSGGGK